MDLTAILMGSQRSTSHARSALPGAPVVERQEKTPATRPKRAAASVLRRFAARLDPSYS